jgi:hypothetical protein
MHLFYRTDQGWSKMALEEAIAKGPLYEIS